LDTSTSDVKPGLEDRDFPAHGAIKKALALLEAVGQAHEATLAELAEGTGLPKSTLMRLLGILVQTGFLQRTSHGHYRAGLKLWRIGASALDQGAVREGVIFVLRQLVALTAETAHYSVYEHGYSVYIESMDGLHPVRHSTAIGDMSPAYASATGKALLAWQDPSEIRRVAAASRPFTPNTLVGVDAIVGQMAKIRADSYCVGRGEWRAGVLGIAAPVFGRTGAVVAAIGVSGPEERVEPHVESYASAVRSAARTLSMQRGAL